MCVGEEERGPGSVGIRECHTLVCQVFGVHHDVSYNGTKMAARVQASSLLVLVQLGEDWPCTSK